jgi:hypothetical protein
MELNFGAKTGGYGVKRKSDKYPDTPVMTMHAREGKRSGARIELNKKCQELLGLKAKDAKDVVEYVLPIRGEEGGQIKAIFLANCTGKLNVVDEKATIQFKKNGVISNKMFYELLVDFFSLGEFTEAVEIELSSTDIDTPFDGVLQLSGVVREVEEAPVMSGDPYAEKEVDDLPILPEPEPETVINP